LRSIDLNIACSRHFLSAERHQFRNSHLASWTIKRTQTLIDSH
jgi:hypothetical protein